jgi:hypothetical protein
MCIRAPLLLVVVLGDVQVLRKPQRDRLREDVVFYGKFTSRIERFLPRRRPVSLGVLLEKISKVRVERNAKIFNFPRIWIFSIPRIFLLLWSFVNYFFLLFLFLFFFLLFFLLLLQLKSK